MRKLTLSIALVASILTAKAQDTTCTMVQLDKVIEFNYQTSKIISSYDNKEITIIKVGYQEVLCLHLYDKKLRVRKVISTYSDGEIVTQVLDSKNDVYFTPLGVVKVEVRRPKLIILR